MSVSLILKVSLSQLQIFTLLYIKHACSPTRIMLAVLLFNSTEFLMKVVTSKTMEKAELSRIGSKNAGFDRFHLVGLTRFAFHCYTSIFKQSLFVNLTDWSSFGAFYLTNTMTHVVTAVMPMSGKWHSFSKSGRCKALLGRLLKTDLLHQRGMCCFNAYLKSRAVSIASLQYIVFILLLQYHPNRFVFPNFQEPNIDVKQQMTFVAIAWSLDYLNYTIINLVFDRRYNMTPMYVGACHLRQYRRFQYSVVLIASHIISDVYLGMAWAMMAGVNIEHSANATAVPDPEQDEWC